RPYQDLLDLVDPYSYRMRYTMPKYLINAAGDQFFLPDSSQFYWDDLPGTKQLRYTPNAGHSRVPTQWEALSAWHNAIIEGDPLPAFTWTKEPDGSLRVFVTSGTPSQVLLWQGSNPTARNFNIDDVGAIYTSSALTEVNPGEYYAPAPTPAQGWTAFFIELTFPSGISHPFIFTTEVSVVPDTYVSAWDPDVDEDGIASSIDTDDDDDGQLDVDDYRPMDTDNDALPNLVDDDDDDDGILDGADPFPYDTDNDGLNNAVDLDDDSDGASDALELQEGTNPLDPNDTPVQMPVGGAALLVLLPACGAAAMRRRQRVDGEDR
ncbi:MAG: hypothetical protein IT368_14535, partial [Candidatus Hydrogenedentes bacterium]|nr:hypothetical protein [Candidatus Hydrogenedentota bacterium]